MTFALTSFFADGTRFVGPGLVRATQTYAFTVTAAATDVDLDLGDPTGTFWTAAQADSTYGEMATQVLSRIEALEDNYSAVKALYTPELASFVQVASLSATGTYTLDIDSTTQLPDYTFYTSGGTTAYTVFVEYLMEPNILPVTLSYNVG
jgi:hypothetical protein